MEYVETPMEDAIQSVPCPDDKTICPDGTTCCKLHDESYHCCHLSNGVCCKDPEGYCCPHATICCNTCCCPFPNTVCCGHYCCDHGTQCDIQHGGCIRSQFLPMLMGLPEFNGIMPKEKVSVFHVLNICVGSCI